MMNVSLEEALTLLEDHAKTIVEYETVTLENAVGRILVEEIVAPFSQPPFDRSPLDGYTFAAISSMGASKEQPVQLKVVGEVCAGNVFPRKVGEGEAVRIMTGAPIPIGCDCVLRQEDTDYGEDVVTIYKALKPYSNYCYKGEDIKEGQVILRKGEKLSSITVGVLASMGIQQVKVRRKIRIGLVCTGDEIISVGKPLQPGKIYNSNGIMLEERAKELGITVIKTMPLEDTPEKVARELMKLKEKVDIIVTTGGVSVGKRDIMHDVFKILNIKRLFWRIQIQPGTPVLAGCIEDKLVIGLSGNPFAALVNFELLVRAVAAKVQGDLSLKPLRIKTTLQGKFEKASVKRRFIRAKYNYEGVEIPHHNHSSGSLYSMSLCNCLIDIPAGTDKMLQGESVNIILL